MEGMTTLGDCLGCKAGLFECCSHVGSVLFYIEVWNHIHGNFAFTQVECTWLITNNVKQELYDKIDSAAVNPSLRIHPGLLGRKF